jgi:spermidine synthase
MLRYRNVIYAGTVFTGLTGLIYQVVWQKYLSSLVGSEARSVALVVAVFLGGLAAGYRFWGKRTEQATSRRGLLRVYGLIEIGIGLYAVLFPLYLRVLTTIGHHAPSWLLTDLLLAAATLLLPTFLMGATIPLLVSVVPRDAAEVHVCHAKIYGINTLGACLGAFGASLVLIPHLGLGRTLMLAGAVNLVVGIVFVFNPLRHSVAKEGPVEAIAHRFPLAAVYAFTLVTGAVTLSLEVLLVRVLGLTVGTGPHNFAIVIGVFVFGLAVGSLMMTTRRLSIAFLFRAITVLGLYLMLLYLSVPYWPYWLSNARMLLQPLPINHTVYLLVTAGFLLLILLPFLIPLGAMLPLVYALIPKGSADYGRQCGRVYFYNTLGTALGAVCFSYLLLYFLDLDQVFKLNVLLLLALAVYLLTRERRRIHAAILGLLALGFVFFPGWDRASHYVGLFMETQLQPFHFQGVFQKPQLISDIALFEDGPDSTLTVTESSHQLPGVMDPLHSRSLVINGKHDGDTLSDYSTITLAAMLPYFHAADRTDLRAAVVGLGTGVTAGVLGVAQDVEHVTAVEISSTLVDAISFFDPSNRGLPTNPKVEILAADGGEPAHTRVLQAGPRFLER